MNWINWVIEKMWLTRMISSQIGLISPIIRKSRVNVYLNVSLSYHMTSEDWIQGMSCINHFEVFVFFLHLETSSPHSMCMENSYLTYRNAFLVYHRRKKVIYEQNTLRVSKLWPNLHDTWLENIWKPLSSSHHHKLCLLPCSYFTEYLIHHVWREVQSQR